MTYPVTQLAITYFHFAYNQTLNKSTIFEQKTNCIKVDESNSYYKYEL